MKIRKKKTNMKKKNSHITPYKQNVSSVVCSKIRPWIRPVLALST